MPSCYIPNEIWSAIFLFAAPEAPLTDLNKIPPFRQATLLSFSLVSSAWCLMSQELLFRQVCFISDQQVRCWLDDKTQFSSRTRSLKLLDYTESLLCGISSRLSGGVDALTELCIGMATSSKDLLGLLQRKEMKSESFFRNLPPPSLGNLQQRDQEFDIIWAP